MMLHSLELPAALHYQEFRFINPGAEGRRLKVPIEIGWAAITCAAWMGRFIPDQGSVLRPVWGKWCLRVAGAVKSLLTGEDGRSWDDDDLLKLINTPFALANLISWNLEEAREGETSIECYQMIRTIADTVATALRKAVQGYA